MSDELNHPTEYVNYHNRDTLFALLLKFGIFKCEIDFDGSGDSGSTQDIRFEGLNEAPENITAETVVSTIQHDWTGKDLIAVVKEHAVKGTLKDVVEEFANGILETTGYDWYNNDGGFGTITIIPGEKKINVEMNIRITTSEMTPIEM